MISKGHKIAFALSLAGGISSFLFGLFLPRLFSLLYLFGSLFVTILQMIIIIGGVITIEGAILFWIKPSISGKLVLIGAILAGVNVISLIGGRKIIKLSRKPKEKKSTFLKTFPYICTKCKTFSNIKREYCENCGEKDSLREALVQDYERYSERLKE